MSVDGLLINGGSFRDPSGTVFEFQGEIYRTVNTVAAPAYEHCRDSGLLQKLANKSWITHWEEIDKGLWGQFNLESHFNQTPIYLLKHERVPFVSYPYEWTFDQLKDAALRHLDIQLEALELGIVLTDASAYNMQFVAAQPLHIDLLSFRPYRESEVWVGYDQFCRHFLYPLLLESHTGVRFNEWLSSHLEGIPVLDLKRLLPWSSRLSVRMLLHVILRARVESQSHRLDELKPVAETTLPKNRYKALLQDMRHWISGLKSTVDGTYWADYAESNSYSTDGNAHKLKVIANFAAEHQPSSLVDLGGNSGEYANTALDNGAATAVVIDGDRGALNHCYRTAADKGRNITPVYMSLTDPSTDRGWNQNERQGFNSRVRADAVLALALIHHLVFSGNVPLDAVIQWIVACAPRGIIEFVPKSDPMVKRMLALREDIFTGYSYEAMESSLKAIAVIKNSIAVDDSGRVLVEYERHG